MFKKVITYVLLLFAFVSLLGCNTARGFQTDINVGYQKVRDFFRR